MISKGELQALMPRADVAKWYDVLCAAMETHFISSPLRQAAFLAQAAHESDELTRVEENLMYTSAEHLRATFPNDFDRLDPDDAWGYIRQPQRIANRVYANQNGNGPEGSGDGWTYRGRGIFQLTGKNNYRAYGLYRSSADILGHPERVAEPEYAADSAGWFWSGHGLNAKADERDLKGITKAINGGYVGWVQRKAYYDRAVGLLVK